MNHEAIEQMKKLCAQLNAVAESLKSLEATLQGNAGEGSKVEVVTSPKDEHWMTMEEARQTLGKSRYTIYKMCREKILEKMRDGQRILISRASVARWMKRFQPGFQPVAKSTRRRK